jgi:hypothetical protein
MSTEICALSLVNSKGPNGKLVENRKVPNFEGCGVAYCCSSVTVGTNHLQATKVMRAPAVAPEAPKQAIVAAFGYFPTVFAWTRGSIPKCRLIHAE